LCNENILQNMGSAHLYNDDILQNTGTAQVCNDDISKYDSNDRLQSLLCKFRFPDLCFCKSENQNKQQRKRCSNNLPEGFVAVYFSFIEQP